MTLVLVIRAQGITQAGTRWVVDAPGIGELGPFRSSPLASAARHMVAAGVDPATMVTSITAPSTVWSWVPAPLSDWAMVAISEGDGGLSKRPFSEFTRPIRGNIEKASFDCPHADGKGEILEDGRSA